MSQQIKVIFKNETKKFRKPSDYLSLLHQTEKAFGSSLPKNFKFFYQDPEGDLISISCQEDLEEAYSSMQNLRLIVESSIQEARNIMEPEYSMRSIHQLNQFQNTFESISNIPRVRQDFEDIGRLEEQKSLSYSHSVGVGEEVFQCANAEAATDAVDIQNFGCNTVGIETIEKQLNAVVDTKDMGS